MMFRRFFARVRPTVLATGVEWVPQPKPAAKIPDEEFLRWIRREAERLAAAAQAATDAGLHIAIDVGAPVTLRTLGSPPFKTKWHIRVWGTRKIGA